MTDTDQASGRDPSPAFERIFDELFMEAVAEGMRRQMMTTPRGKALGCMRAIVARVSGDRNDKYLIELLGAQGTVSEDVVTLANMAIELMQHANREEQARHAEPL